MDTNITWFNFFTVIATLIALYVFLIIVLRFLPQIFKRNSVIHKVSLVLNKIIEIYKPSAVLFILLSFVSIDYKIHGVLFLLFLVITFSYIKRYLHGVLFKINPLVNIGSNISTGEFKGDISKFLHFGLIINEVEGNRFINYSFIDKNGFSINQNDIASVRRTIYIYEQDKSSPILDLLFENPNIDFKNKPIIKKIPNEKTLQLQVALENGAKMESLLAYLNKNNIKTSSTKI
ncbi:hypothetical protein [Polaribacter sp.]|uniref:hypothetical protein n=1 Tax=Polaribacter sp. TaxID=1920175 RepID=UPI003EF0BBBB